MQKIFSIIGIASVAILIIYYCIITPVRTYQDLSLENRKLKEELANSKKETELVYEKFNQALNAHLDAATVQSIYCDKMYFTHSDSHIAINTENNFEPMVTYSCR